MTKALTTIDSETEQARKAFLDAINSLNPIEISWAFGILADAAKEEIKTIEQDVIRHRMFSREEQADKALARIPYLEKLIKLRQLWRDFEMHHSAPAIVAAIMEHNGIKPKVPSKTVKSTTVKDGYV